MNIIREIELIELLKKLNDSIVKLEALLDGKSMPDPVEGQEHILSTGVIQKLSNGKLKEAFRIIDDLEIEFAANQINSIIKKILKLKNYRNDIYTYEYTNYNNENTQIQEIDSSFYSPETELESIGFEIIEKAQEMLALKGNTAIYYYTCSHINDEGIPIGMVIKNSNDILYDGIMPKSKESLYNILTEVHII